MCVIESIHLCRLLGGDGVGWGRTETQVNVWQPPREDPCVCVLSARTAEQTALLPWRGQPTLEEHKIHPKLANDSLGKIQSPPCFCKSSFIAHIPTHLFC